MRAESWVKRKPDSAAGACFHGTGLGDRRAIDLRAFQNRPETYPICNVVLRDCCARHSRNTGPSARTQLNGGFCAAGDFPNSRRTYASNFLGNLGSIRRGFQCLDDRCARRFRNAGRRCPLRRKLRISVQPLHVLAGCLPEFRGDAIRFKLRVRTLPCRFMFSLDATF
jgi:hypothetical protein